MSKKNISSVTVFSPGRINLIGEHIDYNGGNVLPAAINRKLNLNFNKTHSNLCTVKSLDKGKFEFDIDKPLDKSDTHWENYIYGVINEIKKTCNNKLGGFKCFITSDLPIGAGISSSAALSCGVSKGLNELFDLGLSDLELIKISHAAEHDFVGIKCGVMDQFAVIMGKIKKLLILNCETLNYKLIDADFKPFKIVLLNTNVSHNLASSEYNIRRQECNMALSIIQNQYNEYKFLADVPEKIIFSLKKNFKKNIYHRALFVSRENKRTLKAAELIQRGKIEEFGNLMYHTHRELSKYYEVSCKELDFLVDFTKNISNVIGSRMMGGGFGGCTINLVQETYVNEFIELANKAYKAKFNINLSSIIVAISNGVEATKTI